MLSGFLDHGADGGDRLDDVLADPLGHLERDGGQAVDPRIAFRVGEGAADRGDVAELDDGVAVDGDRHLENVGHVLDQPRHLDRETALAAVQRAGRDQAVRPLEHLDDVAGDEAVALDPQGIDDDLDDLLTVAADIDLEHARNGFQVVLELAGNVDQSALGHVARQGHDDDREQTKVDLVDRRLVHVVGQVGADAVDRLAHVLLGLVAVETGLELKHDAAAALIGVGGHLLDAGDAAQLLLDRPHHQPFGVLGGDAIQRHLDVDDRDGDVGVGFLGDLDVGDDTGDQDERQAHQDDP